MAGKIYIGTSGWSYKHWIGTFYPEGTKPAQLLSLYRQSFNTVEINSTFYGVPAKQTIINWKNALADDFVYVVKANRYITHFKKLHDAQEELFNFLENVSALEEKLGPVLFQLPPGLKTDTVLLEDFLKLLPKAYRYTFEFRNQTWYQEETYRLLQKYNCAFCIYQLAGHISPIEVTADFVYIRLHGPKGKYQGNYSEADLSLWAERCLQWSGNEKDVFVYFDNDEKGYAAFNAKRLNELVTG